MKNKERQYNEWLSLLKTDGMLIEDLIHQYNVGIDEKIKTKIRNNWTTLAFAAVNQNGGALAKIPLDSNELIINGIEKLMMIAVKTTPEALEYVPKTFRKYYEKEALRLRPDLFYLAENPTLIDKILGIQVNIETVRYLSSTECLVIMDSQEYKDFSKELKEKIKLRLFKVNNRNEAVIALCLLTLIIIATFLLF